jgi:hypothetical protein
LKNSSNFGSNKAGVFELKDLVRFNMSVLSCGTAAAAAAGAVLGTGDGDGDGEGDRELFALVALVFFPLPNKVLRKPVFLPLVTFSSGSETDLLNT